jgi:hypothetical protein
VSAQLHLQLEFGPGIDWSTHLIFAGLGILCFPFARIKTSSFDLFAPGHRRCPKEEILGSNAVIFSNVVHETCEMHSVIFVKFVLTFATSFLAKGANPRFLLR